MNPYLFKNCIIFQECIKYCRFYSSRNNAIKCFGFTYYKRFPGDEDPPLEKAKLFMIQRVKPFKGRPYWEKNVLEKLGLMGQQSDIVIMKNIPEVNANLWKVKHLVKITPITFPYGEPTEKDIGATYLKENGEFLRSEIVEVNKEQLQASETFANDETRMDTKTLRKQLRYQWLNPRFNGIN